ncbi:hypothetical protein MHU86_13960 [Fragilaria crotonensis]|nr:hypothetical protein MHU86_13960 [Fragilaria crotonensis]
MELRIDTASSSNSSSQLQVPLAVAEEMSTNSAAGVATVVTVTRPPIERVSIKKTCWAWEYIYKLSNGAVLHSRPSATQAVGVPCQFVCRLCFEDDANIPSIDCVVALHKGGISNGVSHLQCKHKLADPSIKTNKGTALVSPMGHQPSATSLGLYKFLDGGNARQLKHVHSLAARLVVNNKLPISTTTSDDFNDLIHAASRLKIDTYVPMTKRKMDYLLIQMFSSFIADVRQLIETTRAHFVYDQNQSKDDDNAAQHRGWVIVCHDGWDSALKQFFGVSIFFINPATWVRYQLALGLATPDGHSAEMCAEAAFHVLNKYGIQASDIYASVNDTTNSAVATGRALSSKDGDCMMHMCNLVADHASGKKVRTRQKVVVDHFPECEALRQKTHQMINFITSKKAKQRMLNYRRRNAEAGKQTIRLGLDNDTRIGGTRRMYEQVLRSRYCIPLYFNQEKTEISQKYSFTDEEWELIAGFEAILRPVCNLSFSAQTDSRPTGGISWLKVVCCKMSMIQEYYQIVDVAFADSIEDRWDTRSAFRHLPSIKVAANNLNPLVAKLRTRLKDELDKYFLEPSDLQCLAMIVDPVMLTTGLPILLTLGHGAIVDRALLIFKEKLMEEATYSNEGRELGAPVSVTGGDECGEDEDDPFITSDNHDDEEDDWARVVRQAKALSAGSLKTKTAITTAAEEANKEYLAWTSMRVDWLGFLTNVQKVSKEVLDLKKIKLDDCLYLSEHVDILLWWRENASLHRLTARVAAPPIAKPEANSFQERVFSCASLIDTDLRQSLGNDKFEMLCVLSFNKSTMKTFRDDSNNLKSLIESLDSASSASVAAEIMIDFYGLDLEHDDLDEQGFSNSTMGDMLRSAAVEISEATSSHKITERKEKGRNNKRRRTNL